MADTTELMLAYVEADKLYRTESDRYFHVTTGDAPAPTGEVVDVEVLLRLSELHKAVDVARQAWMGAMAEEQRQRPN